MKIITVVLLFMVICSCATRQESVISIKDSNEIAKDFYIVLPDNYIIDLEAESEVIVNPGVHEFIVFHSKQEAAKALRREIAEHRLKSEEDWRIYRINGKESELTRTCRGDQLCLNQSTTIIDWVEVDS